MNSINKPKSMLLAALVANAMPYLAVAEETSNVTTDKVEVISTTPLKGVGLPLHKVPANVQMAAPKDINDQTGVVYC